MNHFTCTVRIYALNLYSLYRMAMHTYSPLCPCRLSAGDQIRQHREEAGALNWKFKITQSLLKQPKQLFETINFSQIGQFKVTL